MGNRRLFVSLACMWVAFATTAVTSDAVAQGATADKPCAGTTVDGWIAACTALIKAGTLHGRALAAVHSQRGFAYTRKRKLDLAKKDLDQAISIDPDYAQSYIDRANFWTVMHKPDRALADSETAIRLAPELALAYFVHGSACLNLGQYDRAITDYSKALSLRPDLGVDVYGLRGLAYHRKGDDDNAVADYDALLKLTPNDVGALLNRGDALRNKTDYARAAADYSAAITLNARQSRRLERARLRPRDDARPEWRARRLQRSDPAEPQDAHTYIDRGIAEYSLLGDNTKALADFDAAIKLDPKQPLGYVNRSEPLYALGKHAEAIASVKKALELAPNFPPALETLKKFNAANGRDRKAPRILSAEEGRRNFRKCVFPVANITLDPKTMNEIIAACTVLIESQGGSGDDRAQVYLQRGSMYRRLDKFELAVADFSQSIRYAPKSADAYTGRGNAYRGLKQLDLSIADHSEAIRLDPNSANFYSNRGNAWGDRKSSLRRSLTTIPRSRLILTSRALFLIAAIRVWKRATKMELSPTIVRHSKSIQAVRTSRRC